MDNEKQIEEIKKFHRDLARQGKNIDMDKAALLWIEQNAQKWRSEHNKKPSVKHK